MAQEDRTGAHFVRVCRLADVQAAGCLTVHVEGHTLALFARGDEVHAVDNRCPHMGFPLDRGTLKDGILTCHWHHARFDLASGGTFDLWADDVRAFPAQLRDGEVWVDTAAREDPTAHRQRRLRDGLERDIPLVLAKAVIGLLEGGEPPAGPFRTGLDFGARYRQAGWGQGLTIHACMMNLLPQLDAGDRPRAAYHGLAAVADDCAGAAAALRGAAAAGRHDRPPHAQALVSPVRRGAGRRRGRTLPRLGPPRRCRPPAGGRPPLRGGHRPPLPPDRPRADFTNKALEALDHAGWEHAEPVLTSLVSGYASADRMEEANAWRHPVDLVAILEHAFEALPAALELGASRRGGWAGREALVPVLLGEDAQAIADALLVALREGATGEEVAGAVAYAAVLRIARFHTSNEFGDWDTALHTFTFANAIHQGLRRAPSPELLRGVFDAAMSVYLDRFLNVPPARLPDPDGTGGDPEGLLSELPVLLDRQQQVNEAGELVARLPRGRRTAGAAAGRARPGAPAGGPGLSHDPGG